jgi:hypothetical protein
VDEDEDEDEDEEENRASPAAELLLPVDWLL